MTGKKAQPAQRLRNSLTIPFKYTTPYRATQILVMASFWVISCGAAAAQELTCPPATRKDATVDILHGVSIADPYRWLEDQDSPETRAWIDAENRCTSGALNAIPGRDQIAKRLNELMKTDSYYEPLERNGDYFFTKRAADQDLFVLTRRHGLEGVDEILLDPQGLSPDHSTSITLMAVSRDAAVVAYGIRVGGKDEITIHFLDSKTRRDLADELPQATYYRVAFEPDARGVYYARTTPEGPRIFHHVMGTPGTADAEIFGKGFGTDKIIVSQVSADGHYLLITVIYGSGNTRTELYFKDLRKEDPVRPIVNDTDSVFFGQIENGKLVVRTNWKAAKWHLFSEDLSSPARESWKEIVPESDAPLESASLYAGKIFAEYVRNVVTQVKIFDLQGNPAGEVHLPSLGSISGMSGTWDSPQVFFGFESFNIPVTIYRYEVPSG